MLKFIIGFIIGAIVGAVIIVLAYMVTESGTFHVYNEKGKTRYLFEFNDLTKEIAKSNQVTFRVKVHDEEEPNGKENL